MSSAIARSVSVSPSQPMACDESRREVRLRDATCTSAAATTPSSALNGVTVASTNDPVRVDSRTVPVSAAFAVLFTAAQTDRRSRSSKSRAARALQIRMSSLTSSRAPRAPCRARTNASSSARSRTVDASRSRCSISRAPWRTSTSSNGAAESTRHRSVSTPNRFPASWSTIGADARVSSSLTRRTSWGSSVGRRSTTRPRSSARTTTTPVPRSSRSSRSTSGMPARTNRRSRSTTRVSWAAWAPRRAITI